MLNSLDSKVNPLATALTLAAAALCFCVAPAAAQIRALAANIETGATGAAAPQELAAVEADLNGDGLADRATLRRSAEGDTVDLAIYVGAPDAEERTLAAEAPAIAWIGADSASTPTLETAEDGALEIVAASEASARWRWRSVLTVAARYDGFWATAYAFEGSSAANPDSDIACEADLITGRGVRDHVLFRTKSRAMPIADWSAEEDVPQECRVY